ncbi:MAG: heavy-metal-associated domain-containing protein [Anaerolineaceae bacterium]|nr:heavy-metal-associated domain-containing protein [Anaerolineaceae bacterium]
MIKKTYKIADMHCSSCAMRLEVIEDELEGVRSVRASYQKARMEVEFDETKVSEAAIVEAVKDKGYRVVV